jgi:hypothetical protein
MRKNIIIALAAAVAFAVALPAASTPADARHKSVVIIKKKHHHHDRGRHLGWYKHRHHHHPADWVVIRRDFRY